MVSPHSPCPGAAVMCSAGTPPASVSEFFYFMYIIMDSIPIFAEDHRDGEPPTGYTWVVSEHCGGVAVVSRVVSLSTGSSTLPLCL